MQQGSRRVAQLVTVIFVANCIGKVRVVSGLMIVTMLLFEMGPESRLPSYG